MPEKTPVTNQSHRSYIFPLLIINVGLLFLAINGGYLESSVIHQLLNWWPLLLIFAGLDLLTAKKKWAGIVIAGLTCLVFWGLVLNYQPSSKVPWISALPLNLPRSSAKQTTQNWNLPLEATVSAQPINLNLEVPLGQLSVQPNSIKPVALELKSRVPETIDLVVETSESEEYTKLSYGPQQKLWFNQDWSTELVYYPQIQLNHLKVHLGVGKSNLDLNQLNVNNFSIEQGVGPVTINLQQQIFMETIDVKVGVGGAVLYLPSTADYSIDYQVGIGSVVVDGQVQDQGFGLSGNLGDTGNTIRIEIGVGRLEINQDVN